MNSVYKRYFIITIAALLFCTVAMISNVRNIVGEIDRVNAYVAENGSTKGFVSEGLSFYITESDGEREDMQYPEFDYAGQQCRDNDGGSIWWVVLTLAVAMFYLYERGSSTADFCAVLPVRKRGMFTVKLLGLTVIALVVFALNIWSVYQFNLRVDACNETCRALQMELVYPLDYNLPAMFNSFTGKLCTVSLFLLLAELTGRSYLPPCIFILAMYAVAGSISGFFNYFNYYFDISYDVFRYGILNFRRIYFGVEYTTGIVMNLLIALVFALWGFFLSGRGDISRKGSIFRFKWAENMAVLCIVVCAALCSFAIIYIFELHYQLNWVAAALIMAFSGALAYFVTGRIILLLGR